ncbi:hypothetical protein ACFQH3_11840 [Haladaptatus sp. GCM10025707]|uniref:hypothetical protein n=1 Tax=unclassified Haladaptatus TaxID=2622732 RepID=UPI0023E7F270|nr:hypothetical protein [Haladaptatus sp. QDMS2]
MQGDYTPLYIGDQPEEKAVCEAHGRMDERLAAIDFEEEIFATTDGYEIHQCPTCSVKIVESQGRYGISEEDAMFAMLSHIVSEQWDDGLETHFQSLGPGYITARGEVYTIHLEEFDDVDVPDHIRDDVNVWVEKA